MIRNGQIDHYHDCDTLYWTMMIRKDDNLITLTIEWLIDQEFWDPKLLIIYVEHVGHAREYVLENHISKWDGILIVSGDGLVYEVSY